MAAGPCSGIGRDSRTSSGSAGGSTIRSAVSSHVANDAQGHDARYVRDRRMAWTEVAFNSVGLSIEQIGTDEYSRRTWLR